MVDLVRLVARLDGDDSGFRATMNRASRDLNSFGAQAQRSSSQARGAFASVAAGWTSMAGVLAAVGVGVGFSNLITDASRFEQTLNSIRAVTRATSSETRALSATVRQSAANFRIGANAAASAAYELTKSGVALSALGDGALDAAIVLAQATGGEYADAATIAARATSIFRLETEDMSHVVEGAVQVINAGHFELQDYVLALQQGGAAARDAGLSLDDFNTVLALTQNALGTSGSDTGTATRTFLSRLVPQSEEARQAMRALNLEFYDAQGRFVGLDQAAENLRVAFSGLTDEQRQYNLTTIFGVDAQRLAIALMQDGAAGLASVRDRMAEAGSAAEQAEARTQGFAGATANLSSAFTDLGIAIGESGIMDIMTALTNWAAGGIRSFSAANFAPVRGIPGAHIGDPLNDRLAQLAQQNGLARADGSPIDTPDDYDTFRGAINPGYRRAQSTSAYLDWLNRTQGGVDAGFLNSLLAEPILGGSEELRRQYPFYRDTPMGQEIAGYLEHLGIDQPGRYARNNWRTGLRTGQSTTAATTAPSGDDPTNQSPGSRVGAGEGGTHDFLAWLDQEQAWQDDLDDWLYEVNQTLMEHAKGELGGKFPVQIEGFETEHERLVDQARSLASDIHNTLRDAFIRPDEFDASAIAQSIAETFRGALWDALIGDQMQSFLERMAYALAKSVNGMLASVGRGGGTGTAAGGSGGGFFSWIGSAVSGLFAGFFAEGGYVPPGQWGIAGEEGPESIYGGKTGVTVQSAGEDGGGSVINNFNIDARGADAGVEQRIRIAVAEATQRGAQAGAAGVFAKVRRTTTQ